MKVCCAKYGRDGNRIRTLAILMAAAGTWAAGGRSHAATWEDFAFFDNFDSLTPGTRYTEVSGTWFGWNNTSTFESPIVDSTQRFSLGNSLSNANSNTVVPEEQRAWLESFEMPTLTGGDAVVKFKFLHTVDQGSFINKIGVSLVEVSGGNNEANKFSIDIHSGSLFNNSTNASIFGNVASGPTWYELELRAPWNAGTGSFGQTANVTVRNAATSALVGSGSVSSKFATNLSAINEVQIIMDAGYTNGTTLARPTNFIDDLSLSGKTLKRSPTFGHEYVRNNPLTTMSLVQLEETFIPSQYGNQAGLNTLLAWKPRPGLPPAAGAAGMPWHMQIYRKINAEDPNYADPFTDEIKNLSRQMYDSAPGNTGWMMWDEPRRQHFEKIAEGMDWYRSQFPDSLVYSNVYSAGAASGKYYYDETFADPETGQYPQPPGGTYTYDNYLSDYLSIVKPDVLLVDAYPYPTNTTDFIPTRYFLTLEKIRTHAQAANIPYWNFIQTVQSASFHLPSESDLRMNVYSSLAYGFTGLAYFLYHDPAYTAMLDAAGQPTSLFTHTAAINDEVDDLGDTLKLLTSTNVRFVRGTGSTLPTGTTAWTSGSGGSYITTIVATKTGSMPGPTRGDVLIGHFKPMTDDFTGADADGELYFMLVNLLRDDGATAAQAAQSIRLDFNFGSSGINTLMRLNRLTGEPERVTLIHDFAARYHVSISLGGGTGGLFKFGNGDFAGIPSGDADLDGDVDLSDLSIVAASYGLATGGRWGLGDFDLDGDIDLSDLSRLAANYGLGETQAFADFQSLVPEPASLGWLMPAMLFKRRTRSVQL